MRLLVDPVVARALLAPPARGQLRRQLVHADIQLGVVFGLAGDDQRRARLVDQDRVDFVDDGEVEARAARARRAL